MTMTANRPNPNEAFPNPNIPPNTTVWPSKTCPKIGSTRDAGRGRRSSIKLDKKNRQIRIEIMFNDHIFAKIKIK